jgi:hypothetical protein
MKVHNVLIVSGNGTSVRSLFSTTVQQALDAKCVEVQSMKAAIKALQEHKFDLVISDEDVPALSPGEPIRHHGFALHAYVAKYHIKRLAIVVKSDVFADADENHFNLKRHDRELAYHLTEAQLKSRNLRRSIELELFGVVHKEDLEQ